MATNRDVDIVDEETERFRSRGYRPRQRVLRHADEGSEPAALNAQIERACRAGKILGAGFGARQESCRAGLEPAFPPELRDEAHTGAIGCKDEVVVAVGKKRPAAAGQMALRSPRQQ